MVKAAILVLVVVAGAVAGTLLGAVSGFLVPAAILYFLLDASYTWAVGFSIPLGAGPGAVIGGVAGGMFAFRRMQQASRTRPAFAEEDENIDY